MSFLMNLLRSTEKGEPSQVDDTESVDNREVDEPIPLPPQLPPRSLGGLQRDRSLSRVFNELPQELPDLNTIQCDVLEYLCHLILHESDHERMVIHKNHLVDLLKKHHEPKKYGRFYCRLLLTRFAADMLTTPIDEDSDDSLFIWPAHFWEATENDLETIKETLLRKDADLFVPTRLRDSISSENIPESNSLVEQGLLEHEMFTDQFPQVLLNIRVQKSIAVLRDSAGRDKKAGGTFKTSMESLFGDDEVPRCISMICSEMQEHKVADQIRELTLNPANEFSLSQLQKKARSLLTKWSESILRTPNLVRLGYGGVMAPIEATAEDDDISTFSDNKGNDYFLTQPQQLDSETRETSKPATPSRSILKQRRVPSKDLRRVARQNIEAEKVRQLRAGASEDIPMANDSDSERESAAPDPDEDKLLAQIRDEYLTRSGRKSLLKRDAPSVWDDSDVEEYASCYSADKRIRHTPKRNFRPRSPPRTPVRWTGSPGKAGMPRTPVSGRKNRPYSRREVACIRDGFAKHGSQWAKIGQTYPELHGRTGQHIRDKARTMSKAGEL